MIVPDERMSHLTVEQRRAVAMRSVSVALGAGAGCGKTTVLTERFLAEIEQRDADGGGRALQALVALTFTDKAARELRHRIRLRCRVRQREGQNPGPWQVVLRALEAAPVGTFHEFCSGLLRENALDLGIDPEFTILSETIATTLRDQAIRSAVRKLLAARDPDLLQLGVDYGLRVVREALGLILANRLRGDLAAWSALDSATIVSRWRTQWELLGRPATIAAMQPAAQNCRAVLESLPDTHPRLSARRDDVLLMLQAFDSGVCEDRDLDGLRALARVDDLRQSAIWPSPEIKEAVKQAFERLRKAITDVTKKLAVSQTVSLESAENSLRMIRLAQTAAREYNRIKALRRGLDFDDLLTRTLDLLNEREGAPLPLGLRDTNGKFDFILVDEFQDTDFTQSEILRRLGGSGFQAGRMFVVGDTKQSIYRFRGAEPEIFDRWRGEYPEDGRLSLTENFRSVPGIIHFANALFADTFRPATSEGPGASFERLSPVRDDAAPEPAVTFLWALPSVAQEQDDGATPKRPSTEKRRAREARILAEWILDRLRRGWTVVDRDSKQARPAHAGDVVLLFRSMTDVWHYESALADAGFDYHTTGGAAFFAQQEIRDAVNVLSAIEDPFDEISLAGALRSPFFGLSDDGLFWLARSFEGGLTTGLGRVAEVEPLSDRDRSAAVRAAELLAHWREIKDRVPLASLVAKILDESGFEATIACEFLGARKLANTRKLIRLAREFDVQENFSLADLVARLRADLDRPPREEQASTTEENSPTVRLMSIHQAKGLEFPIVVLPDINRKSKGADSVIGVRPNLGLVIRPVRALAEPSGTDERSEADQADGGCVGWRTFRAIETEEERKEALRLFYVAVTRARDHLVLSSGFEGEIVDQPRAESPAFRLLLERFDLETGECRAELPAAWPLPRVQVHAQRPDEPDQRLSSPSPRSRLQEIERLLTETPASASRADVQAENCPRYLDLSQQSVGTESRESRFDRLVVLAITEPELSRHGSVVTACIKAGQRLAPAASSRLAAEAAHWLEDWTRTPLHDDLRDALRSGRPIHRAVSWSLPWSGHDGMSTLIVGTTDVIYQDRGGRWRPVAVGSTPDHEDTDLLRLDLAAAGCSRLGQSPCGPGWWVHRGPDGALRVETRLPASPTALAQAVGRWLNTRRPPSRTP